MRRMRSRCCARAASGHAAAAPPNAVSNSRRPMVTVMRPSRARCVEGRIPRHERTVFTVQGGQVLAIAAAYRRAALIRAAASLETAAVMCRPREGQYLRCRLRRRQSPPSPARAERLSPGRPAVHHSANHSAGVLHGLPLPYRAATGAYRRTAPSHAASPQLINCSCSASSKRLRRVRLDANAVTAWSLHFKASDIPVCEIVDRCCLIQACFY